MTGIIGIGNLLLKDEGLGVHFVNRLKDKYAFDPQIKIIDGSTLGYGLLNEIFELDNIIVVDALKTDEEPGSIFRFEEDNLPVDLMKKTAHDVEFIDVITLSKIQGHSPKITIFAISPEDCHGVGMDLSPAVESAILRLEELIIDDLKKLGHLTTLLPPSDLELTSQLL